MKMKRNIIIGVFLGVLLSYKPVYAMHIMEGFLPPLWAGLWFVVSIPFLFLGIKSIKKLTDENSNLKMILGLCAAFEIGRASCRERV